MTTQDDNRKLTASRPMAKLIRTTATDVAENTLAVGNGKSITVKNLKLAEDLVTAVRYYLMQGEDVLQYDSAVRLASDLMLVNVSEKAAVVARLILLCGELSLDTDGTIRPISLRVRGYVRFQDLLEAYAA